MQRLPDSTWRENIQPLRSYPKLDTDLTVDVAIIGAGLAGLCTAYELSKTGLSVAVFEKSNIGDSATGYTTAFVTYVVDTALQDLSVMYGAVRAKMVWEYGKAAIEWLEQTVKSEGMDDEFMRCPLFVFANHEKDFKHVEREAKAAKNFGFPASTQQQQDLGFKNAGYYELSNQAKCHGLKVLFGLAKAAERRGVRIFENTEIKSVSNSSPLLKTSTGHKVKAKWTVMATYRPIGRQGVTWLKKAMYKSYVVEANIPSGRLKEAMYLDSSSPYHYFRVDRKNGYDRLILGGEDHRKDIRLSAKKSFAALREYLDALVGKGEYEFVRQWDGQILEPIDGLPLIGLTKPNQLVATAFSGNGFTYAPVAAMLCRDIILGKENPWQKLYNPKRLPTLTQMIYKGRDYSKILIGGALKNWFRK